MAKSVRDVSKRKRRGRPKTTGRGAGVLVRLHDDAMKALDAWSADQADAPSRPEAIRRLVDMALASVPTRKSTKKTARRASELAGTAIDWLIDQSAPAEERAKRKRRLIKGPPEFRDMRADLPKPKR